MEEIKMQCPECKSTHIRKNGINKQGKQNHICVTCGCQFIDHYGTDCLYEKIIPLEVPYFLFYPVFLNFLFAIYRIFLVPVFQDKNSLINQFLNTQLLSLMPVIFIFLRHQFENIVFSSVKDVFGENEKINSLLEKTSSQTFSVNNHSLFYVSVITLSGSLTVYRLGIPTVTSLIGKIIVFGILAVLIFFGSHLSYVLFCLLGFLKEITHLSPRESFPFYRLPNPSINRLQNYYLLASLMLAVSWICFAVATWYSPYGINNPVKTIETPMIYWLIITGSGPLMMFLWTYFCIQRIVYNIKQLYISKVNKNIQAALNELFDGQGKPESLKNYLELQDKIQNIKEWPVNFASISTFLATLGTLLGTLTRPEVMGLIKNLLKPLI
jgi:hypothetical protein